MIDIVKDFWVNMLLLANFSAIRLFFHYVIIWFIIEVIAYNVEKMIGVPTVYRWYDFVITAILVWMYLYNIQYLLDAIKSRM